MPAPEGPETTMGRLSVPSVREGFFARARDGMNGGVHVRAYVPVEDIVARVRRQGDDGVLQSESISREESCLKTFVEQRS